MKRFLTIFFLCLIVITSFYFGLIKKETNHNDFLRIHIRANSNLEIDQNVKYRVKDAIVEYLTPLISNCNTKEDFLNILQKNLNNIECISNNILAQNSFDYFTTAFVNNEYFPVRTYDGFTLENGYYDALIINLGSGKGDNWWCVVYPPLCFTNSSNQYYKSRIVEIIKKYFGG